MTLPRVLADLPVSPVVDELLGGRAELVPWNDRNGRIDAIYTYGHPTVDAAMLDRLPGVRVISNFGVGVDHIDVRAATGARHSGWQHAGHPRRRNGRPRLRASARRRAACGRGGSLCTRPELHALRSLVHARPRGARRTLGIIGMGRIGRQVAKRAHGFGMTVLYHNRTRSDEAEVALGATYATKDELLSTADYVVLTVPLTAETRGLIGRAELARMKPTATLVNVARGAVVDKDALADALASRKIHAAALDVTDPEPLPRDHPLLKLDNVIITPHLGSATEETRRKMAEISVENLFAGLAGRELPFRVNPSGQ